MPASSSARPTPLRLASSSEGLGSRIGQVRRRLRLSQVAFGTLLGVTRNTIGAYERGHQVPRTAVLDRIAQAGNVTVEWLLHGRGATLVQQDKAWRDAVELLRAVWREPERRATILSMLKALRPP